jgi:serine/threonine protein phosphatase PrpC
MTADGNGSGTAGSSILACPSCQEPCPPGALWCEGCGAQLRDASSDETATQEAIAAGRQVVPAVEPGRDVPFPMSTRTLQTEAGAPEQPPACTNCGGTYAADGYCETCGSRRANPRDHFSERPAPWVAGVCDRGVRKAENEDAMALSAEAGQGGRAVLVVCDGVSNTVHSELASLSAARAARDHLTRSRPQGIDTQGSRAAALRTTLVDACDAAWKGVIEHTPGGVENPPSCTFTAGVVQESLLVVANIGDSRAYWLPDQGEALAVTVDDSVAAEQIAAGMPRAEAEQGPQGHAITRWLGIDGPEGPPKVTSAQLEGAGWVLLCSDGLWNYCSEAADLADLVRHHAETASGEPLAVADALVAFANEKGGQDNITVALARIDPR